MNRKTPFNNYFQALPPYAGGKRKLIGWIFNRLNRVIPQANWETLTFLDAFAGGGAVSLYAKAQNFKQIQSNDWSARSQFIIEGLLQNQQVRLSQQDKLRLVQPLAEGTPPGFIETTYAPSVFSQRHARALDRYFRNIQQLQCPTTRSLAKLVGWRLVCEFVCMPTSIGTSSRPYAETLDGLRDWQELNPKRFVDGSFPRLLKPSWSELDKLIRQTNQGVFTGSPVIGSQLDAFDFVLQANGDILYLDPPYPGTLNYEGTNRTLDHILLGIQPEVPKAPSLFSKGCDALEALLDAAQHIPVWVLSYGNAVLSLDELESLIKRVAPGRTLQGEARAYRHMAHVSRQTDNQELLIIAYQ